MKSILFALVALSVLSLSAHAAPPTGCNGWGAYCTDFSGQDHASVEIRKCDGEVMIANGKEYDPVSASSWRSKDGYTIRDGNPANGWQMIFGGPDGKEWSESCATQD